MKAFSTLVSTLLLLQASLYAQSGAARQASPAAQSPNVIHASSNLVLVDVIALNTKTGLPDNSLKRDDFQLFDNGGPVSIATFDSGSQTRPLALWFVVQCNMQGYARRGSGLFAEQVNRFKPALQHMEKQDAVGVAQWCDDGQSNLDQLPTSNVDEAITALAHSLMLVPDTESHERTGELALQKTLQLIVDATRSSQPQPLPVIIFLYADYSGMPKSEADHFINELLETSAIAFGLRDRRSERLLFLLGEQKEIAHYIATQTGGQYLNVTPEIYASGLEKILRQLHFRYELGFTPEALDGKRHTLTVKLAPPARSRHKQIRLRHRAAYVPVRQNATQ